MRIYNKNYPYKRKILLNLKFESVYVEKREINSDWSSFPYEVEWEHWEIIPIFKYKLEYLKTKTRKIKF